MKQPDSEYPVDISPRAVKDLIDANHEFLLLDCRTEEEYAIAHIEVAKLVPMHQIPGRINEILPDPDRQVIVYCHLGGRSLQVTQWLRERGFSRAQNMAGGIDAWAIDVDPATKRY